MQRVQNEVKMTQKKAKFHSHKGDQKLPDYIEKGSRSHQEIQEKLKEKINN